MAGVDAPKYFKDVLKMLRSEADAIVFKAKANVIVGRVGLGPNRDLRLNSGRDEFNSVTKEVGDALGQVSGMGRDGGKRRLDRLTFSKVIWPLAMRL
jgi:hypothetical protein